MLRRAPTADDLIDRLPYLSMAVDETLRKYPPVWFGPRLSVKPFEFQGYHLPTGGQRVCIGKRFGQLVVRAVAAVLLLRFRCELKAGYELRPAKVPTLSPEGGPPMVVRPR